MSNEYETPLSSSCDSGILEPPTVAPTPAPEPIHHDIHSTVPVGLERKVMMQLQNCVSPQTPEDSGPDEEVIVYPHEESDVEDMDDVKALLTEPFMLSAAQKLDINLRRVRRGRLCCAGNMLLLLLCLSLQVFAWYIYYHVRECDKKTGTIYYSLNSEIDQLRNSIRDYDPSPIINSWPLASVSVSSNNFLAVDGVAVVESEYRKVNVLIADTHSADRTYEVADFTSYFQQVKIPRPSNTGNTSSALPSTPLHISFNFVGSNDIIKNFSRYTAIPLNTSDWSQTVSEVAWCVNSADSTTAAVSCNESSMIAYCVSQYGSEAFWESPSSTFSNDNGCPKNSPCGMCTYKRYLANFSVVVSQTAPHSSSSSQFMYGPDPYLQSPLWPFNNNNYPPFAMIPPQDVSTLFVVPQSNGNSVPSEVTVRIYKSDDPIIELQRLTQGTNKFVSFNNFDVVNNDSSTTQFGIQGTIVMASCGIPYMVTAWVVFIVLLVALILICRKFPNFGLEADFDHEIETEYEDYDQERIPEEKNKSETVEGEQTTDAPQLPQVDTSSSFSSANPSQPLNHEPLT